jgi:hypothetical protein
MNFFKTSEKDTGFYLIVNGFFVLIWETRKIKEKPKEGLCG